jgi:hypothetical protein
LNNFSPVQPILTSNIQIDSARQAETHGNIKNVSDFILGQQRGTSIKNTPFYNSLTIQLIVKSYTDRFSSTSRTEQYHQNSLLGEHCGIFKQLTPNNHF